MMIEQLDHVCAQTPPTTAQRRATLIADATVLANRTFGREAIAALQGQWYADDECAELRFTVDGEDYYFVHNAEDGPYRWGIGHVDTMAMWTFEARSDTPTDVATSRLRGALTALQEWVREIGSSEVVA